MSKKELSRDETKELMADLKKAKKPSFDKVKEAWIFIKQLVGVLFGLSIAGLGAYAVMQGLEATSTLRHYAFIVSGSCAIINGFYAMYYALRKVK